MIVSLHDGDHDGTVRISFLHAVRFDYLFRLVTRHNFSPTRSVIGSSYKDVKLHTYYLRLVSTELVLEVNRVLRA